jgi:hypothetical protein
MTRPKGGVNKNARYLVYYSPKHYEEPRMDSFSSISAMARYLRMSRTTIYNHIKSGRWDFYSRDCKYYEIIKLDKPTVMEGCLN